VIKILLDKTIKYFLGSDIIKRYAMAHIARDTGEVKYQSKQLIYKYGENIDTIEIQLKTLFNSIAFRAPIRKDYNYCIKFSLGKTHKNFYVIKEYDRYLLTWGINHNSVREICNELNNNNQRLTKKQQSKN
jgi:hypothetical protein